jgi:hypothetical protein
MLYILLNATIHMRKHIRWWDDVPLEENILKLTLTLIACFTFKEDCIVIHYRRK